MAYTFDKERIKGLISRVDGYTDNVNKISYKVPIELKEELDILIEQDIGGECYPRLDDCQEYEEDGFICGYIILTFEADDELSFDERHEIIFARASQFDIVNNGEHLIVNGWQETLLGVIYKSS